MNTFNLNTPFYCGQSNSVTNESQIRKNLSVCVYNMGELCTIPLSVEINQW